MSAWVRVDSDDCVGVDIDDAVDLTGIVDDFRVRVVVDCGVLLLLGIHTSRGEQQGLTGIIRERSGLSSRQY